MAPFRPISDAEWFSDSVPDEPCHSQRWSIASLQQAAAFCREFHSPHCQCIHTVLYNLGLAPPTRSLCLACRRHSHLASAKYFSKIDLVSGFHQILLRPSDCPKTAFGLMNAPATFQHLRNLVFRDYMHRFVLAYMEDILVYSNTEAEHRHQLRLVLQRLREHRLFAQAAKCSFFVTTGRTRLFRPDG